MHKLILGCLLAASFASPAGAMMASSGVGGAAATLDLSAPFSEQRQVIEKKLADGKTYSEISAADRSKVRDALARMSTILETEANVNALSESQKASVFNDQEVVNTILTQASEDSRVICERMGKVGSHRKTTQCLTVAERKRLRDSSQDTIRKVQNITPQLGGN